MKQTKKLVETKMIFAVEPAFSLIQELLLVKISTDGADVEALKEIVAKFGANMIDVTSGCLVTELAASSQVIDDYLEAISGFKMVEMCRSGAIAMERGNVVYDLN